MGKAVHPNKIPHSKSLLPPPPGHAYVVNGDGKYFVNANGSFIIAKV